MSSLMAEPLIFARNIDPALRRQIRLDAGLSLREVGEVVGASGTAVLYWETGRHRPSGDAGRQYCAFLHRLAIDRRIGGTP